MIKKKSEGKFPPVVEYEINNFLRNERYWLADGIYPKWPVFVQTISFPSTGKEKCFSTQQEERIKDVERDFGVMQAKLTIVARPVRS